MLCFNRILIVWVAFSGICGMSVECGGLGSGLCRYWMSRNRCCFRSSTSLFLSVLGIVAAEDAEAICVLRSLIRLGKVANVVARRWSDPERREPPNGVVQIETVVKFHVHSRIVVTIL